MAKKSIEDVAHELAIVCMRNPIISTDLSWSVTAFGKDISGVPQKAVKLYVSLFDGISEELERSNVAHIAKGSKSQAVRSKRNASQN
jgi:hypothetical protein